MTPSQIVTLLSPVFVGLAGWVVTLIANHLPGHPALDKSGVAAVFIAGASFAAVKLFALVRHLIAQEAKPPKVVAGPPGPAGARGLVGPPGVAGSTGTVDEAAILRVIQGTLAKQPPPEPAPAAAEAA